MVLALTSCGESKEIQTLKKENAELKEQISSLQKSSASKSSPKHVAQDLFLNMPYEIKTKYGSYKITITGAEVKDWRERSLGSIENLNLLLNYEVENVDFSNEYASGCYADSNLFYVYDDKKTLLRTSGESYDTSFPDIVLPGYKGQFNLCYDLNGETTYIDVTLHRMDEEGKDIILGKLRIDL